MSWYSKGKKGMEDYYNRKKLKMENQSNTNVKRFFLPINNEATILFLDNEPFFADIHRFEYQQTWNNYITCIKNIGDCPLCNAGLVPTFTAHYTIIDSRSFIFNGKEYKNQKRIFPARGIVIEILNDLKNQYTGLRGVAVKIKRYQKKEVSTGSSITFIKKYTEEELHKLFEDKELIKPYNFETILAPPSDEIYRQYGFNTPKNFGDINGGQILNPNIEVNSSELNQKGNDVEFSQEDNDVEFSQKVKNVELNDLPF